MDATFARPHPTPVSPARGELAWAALVFALLALAWLARPIARLDDAVFAPTDVVQGFPLTRIEGAGTTVNGTQGDVAVQFLPWLAFQEGELRAGRVPLWNPYVGGGVPQLANGQSAVFSPFSLPFYALDAPVALIASAFLRLWIAAFAGYWLLRELASGRLAAACGALVLAASGHQTILLQYPHSAVAASALLALACAARAANELERGGRALGASAGCTLALAAAALAGHPEVLFFAGVLHALLAAGLALRARRAPRPDARALARRVAGRLGACALLAAGLAAFQWLPFLEYLAESTTLAHRGDAHGAPPPVLAARLVFPELLGGPPPHKLLPHAPDLLDVAPTTVFHVGASALALALAGLVLRRRERPVVAAAALALAAFVLAQDVAGLGALVHALPLVGRVPWNRDQLLWTVAVAFLAARGVDALSALAPGGRRLAFAGALLFVAASLALGLSQAEAAARAAGSAARGLDALDGAHVARVTVGFLLGAAFFLALRGRARVAGGLALLAAIADQTAVLHHAYVPLSDARTLTGRSPAWRGLAALADGGTFAVLGNDLVPPQLNVPDRVRQIASYDALWVRDLDALYQACFGYTDNWRRIRGASEKELLLFGVDTVVARGDGAPLEVALADGAALADPALAPELRDGGELVQELVLPADGVLALEVTFGAASAAVLDPGLGASGAPPASLDGRLAIRVEDGLGAELATRALDLAAVRLNARGLRREALQLARPASGAARIRVAARGSTPGHGAAFVLDRVRPARPGWSARLDGAALEGDLRLAARAAPRRYARVAFPAAEALGLAAWRRAGGPARYRFLADALAAGSAAEARDRARALAFDPERELVLEGRAASSARAEPPASDAAAGTVRVVREDPGRVELDVDAARAGWLRAAQPFFPGWTARVDGRAAALLRADGAFTAVAVPAGAHRIELVYAPASFRAGLALALASALLGVSALVRARRPRAA